MESAYILHTRPYRETSLIVEVMTHQSGRFSLLAKGIKRSPETRFLLQPFTPLLIAWRGKGDLPVLTKVESNGHPIVLQSVALLSAFYLNELLMRVLHRHDPSEVIFELYRETLHQLAGEPVASDNSWAQQAVLRRFEKQLLKNMGYGLPLVHEFNSDRLLQDDVYYQFIPERGFVVAAGPLLASDQGALFIGKHLLNIATDRYEEKETLQAAKRLMRLAFSRLLGGKPLKSRELFK